MKLRLTALLFALMLLLTACGQAPTAEPAPTPDTPQMSTQPAVPKTADTVDGTADASQPATQTASAPAKTADNAAETGKEHTTTASQAEASSTAQPQSTPSTAGTSQTEAQPSGGTTQPPKETPVEQPPAAATCTISIVCHTAVGQSSYAPSSGVILSATTVTLSGGESVYDILQAVCSANGIALNGSSSYIKGIAGLCERDCGGGSGWMYSVNGSFPSSSCGSCSVKNGDSILWAYTCELGADL